jgi:O-antigen biosynthesis protein
MRYQAVIDPSNKNNSHTLTIDFIADAAKYGVLEILDVGCSAGYLGEYLRTQGHHVTGIDITPEAITKAAEFLNEAHCMKVEDYFITHPNRKFDVVIFGDVLEHVTNAEDVLRLTAGVLKTNGRVIASIPNVSHLAVRAMLLEGRWEYADLGLLDRDHVRFFTKSTIEKLFLDSGFQVGEMRTTNLSVDIVENLCKMNLNPSFVNAAKKIVGNDPAATVFQYVTMAQLKSNAYRVVCMVPEMSSGLFDFRVSAPLNNWAKRYGGQVRFRILGEHEPDDLIWGDVYLFQRLGGAYTLQLIKLLKSHGKRVVFEIDDLLTELPIFLAHHQSSPETQKTLLDVIALANIVTTTTPRLSDKLKEINPNIVCVPNCIKDLPDERTAHFEKVAPIATLIVASSDAVLVDCLIEPLRYIQKKYGTAVKLIVIGPITKALEKGGLSFSPLPILNYKDFKILLQSLVNPIGLIPLDDSVFSACKSPIKYFDYSIAQIPSICSKMPPYADYVKNDVTGLLVDNTAEAWIEAIDSLMQSATKRCDLSDAARNYVINTHLTDKAGDAWQMVINQLNIQHVVIPDSIETFNFNFRPNISIRWIAIKLTQSQTYKKLYFILKNEGVVGVKKRLLRL